MIYLPRQKNKLAVVRLSDNAPTLIRNLQRNFDLLGNAFGLAVTLSPVQFRNDFAFHVNASHFHRFAPLKNASKAQSAGL